MSNVKYEIGAEWTGGKATKKAEASITGLEKLARDAAKSFAGLFAAHKIWEFSKSAVTAVAAEDRAFKILGNTLNNVGLSYDAASQKSFVMDLQDATNITEDQLIPAYAQLIRATNDVADAQRILKLATDVSIGTGKDLNTVTLALQKAYLGNSVALGRLGAGLTKAELTSKNFELVFNRLTTLFQGDAATALATTEGKIKSLGVAAEESKKAIGQGLIDALTMLGENQSVGNLATEMKSLSLYTADVIRGVAVLSNAIAKIPGVSSLKNILFNPNMGSILGILEKLGKAQRVNQAGVTGTEGATADSMVDYTAKLKRQKAAQDALIAAQMKAAKATKDAATLAKGSALFNMNSIQIQAALKGKITEEDKVRLQLLQAIEDKDAAAVDIYTKQLEKIQGINTVLNALATEFKPEDPFAAWLTSLGLANKSLQALIDLQSKVKMPGTEGSGSGTQDTKGGITWRDLIPTTVPNVPTTTTSEDLSRYMAQPAPAGDYAAQVGQYFGGVAGMPPIVVQIDGQTIATALADQNASGVQSSFRGSALTVL